MAVRALCQWKDTDKMGGDDKRKQRDCNGSRNLIPRSLVTHSREQSLASRLMLLVLALDPCLESALPGGQASDEVDVSILQALQATLLC